MNFLRSFRFKIGFLILFTNCYFTTAQDYEVADIDCAIGTGGKELLTARLRRPDGFRGMPIFADDRGTSTPGTKEPSLPSVISQELSKDSACQIISDPTDTTGRVFKLRVTDFSQCGVLKRNGFINVRVWFPQLPGVVMLSDQEVIIMCKPPAATVVQSKTAGFAGSIPSGARVSGIVEESPGRLEYEVALYRETASSHAAGRSSSGASAFITGVDSHELPVDQAVPIGTRLQLRARINHESAWKHAKLMEVSVSPDPKNPNAEGSVALVRDGCRNPELASIIPKQPYRYKERTNEVVLDFEAFLLSNMGDRSTLWLHTQIKACMESQDCHPEFCMDVYQPSGYGRRRRRRRNISPTMIMSSSGGGGGGANNSTSMEYSSPLSQHWTAAIADDIIIDNEPIAEHGRVVEKKLLESGAISLDLSPHHSLPLPLPSETVVKTGGFTQKNLHKENIDVQKYLTKFSSTTSTSTSKSTTPKTHNSVVGKKKSSGSSSDDETGSTKFGDNIGFSVIMPSDYYRSSEVLSTSYECKGWATATLLSMLGAVAAGLVACAMSYKLKKSVSSKGKPLYSIHSHNSPAPPQTVRTSTDPMAGILDGGKVTESSSRHHQHQHQHHHKYARDPSIYRS